MTLATIIAAAVLLAGQPQSPSPSQPAEEPPLSEEQQARQEEARQRVQYRALIRDIRKLDQDYERAVARAMDRARASETGEASLSDQAELLAIRDRRDRLLNRLTLLALRHGWDVPDFSAESAAGPVEAVEGKAEVFAGGAAVLRSRFEAEAARAASVLELPVVTLIVER